MIFVDDLKWAVNIMLHPEKATQTWTVGNALVAYWKVAVIPMVLAAILASLLGGVFANQLSALGSLAGGALGGLLVVGVIINYLILIPIGLLIFALFVHVVGSLFKVFKGSYNATFSALVYGILPYIVLSWIPIISVIGQLWDIVVTVFALSNIQKTTKLMAFVTWIGAIIVIGIIGVIVGIVVGVGLLSLVGASHVIPTTV